MNAERRKKLKDVIDNLNTALSVIEEVKDEEQDSYDNLPESIQDGERGGQMQENIDNLGYLPLNALHNLSPFHRPTYEFLE